MAPGVGEWGGTHTYMRELLQTIDYDKFNVIIVSRKVYASQPDQETLRERCKLVNLEFGAFEGFDKKSISSYHDFCYDRILKILKALRFKPDVIHSAYWNSGYLADRIAEHYKIAYVHSVISNALGRNSRGAKGTAADREQTEKIVYAHAKYILCVSDSEKNDIVSLYGIAPEKVIVAGQFIHQAFLYPSHNEWGAPRSAAILTQTQNYLDYAFAENGSNTNWWTPQAFVYVGRLHPDKGIACIVQAWHRLYVKYKEKCPPLWLIGGNAEDIASIRKNLGLDRDVLETLENNHALVWWGYLDEIGISTVYLKSICLVTHSLYEPGGRVAVEALCEGLPVLATPNGFASDIIQDWDNGFLIRYGDIDALALRMEHFFRSPYLSSAMRESAKKCGLKAMQSWDFAQTHMRLYESAAKNSAIAPPVSQNYTHNRLQRRLTCYPFAKMQIDAEDVMLLVETTTRERVTKIEKLHDARQSSNIWRVSADQNEYLIKIPYDRIEWNALWDVSPDAPYYTPASKRYYSEKTASEYAGIAPIVGCDDATRAIVRRYYRDKELPPTEVLRDINEIYRLNPVGGDFKFDELNGLIEQGATVDCADEFFGTRCNGRFLEKREYSLRIESLRWYRNYCALSNKSKENLKGFVERSKDMLFSVAATERGYSPILVQGGCNVKNLAFDHGRTMFVDNERMHFGWAGVDYADYLITYANQRASGEAWWSEIVERFDETYISRDLLIGWLLLSGWKTAVSDQIINPAPISKSLEDRQRILLNLLSPRQS